MQCQIEIAGTTLWVEAENESQVENVISDTGAIFGPLPGNEDGVSVYAPSSVIDYRLPHDHEQLKAALHAEMESLKALF